MGTRIESMIRDTDGRTIFFRTEHGEAINAVYVADDRGHTIANVCGDDGPKALEITDFGGGDAEYYEHQEGDTFDADCIGEYVVRGGEWVEAAPPE